MVYKKAFILLLLLAFLFSFASANDQNDETLVPNYPLEFVRYIYGKTVEGINDTEDQGGTPVSCVCNSKGDLYILYTGNRFEIQVFDPQGKFKSRFGEKGKADGKFSAYACGLAINSKDEVFVADVFKKQVIVFNQHGKYLRAFSSVQEISPDDPKKQTYPAHIAIDSEDQVYISDGLNGHVWIYSREGKFLKYLGSPKPGLFPSAGHIRFDSKGQIYILEGLANTIQVCTPQGHPIIEIGKYGSREGEFLRISGLAIDSQDRIYATDIVQCVIQVFDTQGNLLGVSKEIVVQGKNQKLNAPSGIFVSKDDLIYVIEQPLHRIVVLKNPK